MSGLECVGLLLGIIPILVSCAEHYRTVHRPIRAAARPSATAQKLADFYQDLHVEVCFLDINVGNLICGLPELSQTQLRSLGNFSQPSSWDNEEVSVALKDRLGATYEPILVTVKASLKILDDLLSGQTLLSLKSHNVSADESNEFSKLSALQRNIQHGKYPMSLLERIKFSTREDKRTRLLKKLGKNNVNMERLLNQALPESPQGSAKHRTGKAVPKRHFWKLLHALYEVMAQQLSCCCSSHHQGRICLVNSLRTSLKKYPPSIDLDILLSRKYVEGSKQRKWQESSIAIVPDSDSSGPRLCVKFADFGLASRPRVDSFAESASPALDSDSQTKEMIDNICELLELAQENNCSLRMQYDGQQLWQVSPKLKRLWGLEAGPPVSLGTFLRNAGKMTLKQKRTLAVILAHSMLQYCGSPWMSEDWNKEYIEFFHQTMESHGTAKLDLERPYLSKDFVALRTVRRGSPKFPIHPCPSVLALGILLLEIELGVPIESERSDSDLKDGKVNATTDLFTAYRILRASYDEMYKSYFNIIQSCLDCKFLAGLGSPSLDDEGIRQAVYDEIVAPLEEELNIGWGITVDQLSNPHNISAGQVPRPMRL